MLPARHERRSSSPADGKTEILFLLEGVAHLCAGVAIFCLRMCACTCQHRDRLEGTEPLVDQSDCWCEIFVAMAATTDVREFLELYCQELANSQLELIIGRRRRDAQALLSLHAAAVCFCWLSI